MGEYNWCDIDCGNFDLNHSENFFVGTRHIKHEKPNTIFDFPLPEVNNKIPFSKNIKKEMKSENKDFPLSQDNNKISSKNVKKEIKSENIPPNSSNLKSVDNSNLMKQVLKVNHAQNLHRQPLSEQTTASGSRSNLKLTDVPSVYKYQEIYEKKKQRKLREMLDQERKNRQFHSRPVPNFNKKSIPDLPHFSATIPITPVVLKNSREVQAARKLKLEEMRKNNQIPKLIAREAKVLNESPFMPKKISRTVQPAPFNLHVEKRLEERKFFDEFTTKKLEEKKKQEEVERKKQDENLSKELRKMTTFKARPNPFK